MSKLTKQQIFKMIIENIGDDGKHCKYDCNYLNTAGFCTLIGREMPEFDTVWGKRSKLLRTKTCLILKPVEETK